MVMGAGLATYTLVFVASRISPVVHMRVESRSRGTS
jgi:hypothetical protein